MGTIHFAGEDKIFTHSLVTDTMLQYFSRWLGIVNTRISLKKVLSVFLMMIVSISCVSCDGSDVDLYRNQYSAVQNQNSALEQKLKSKDDELKSQASQLYGMAEQYNSINAYEIFLKSGSNLDDLKKKAVRHIYELTRKADLIEGYQYFLNRYPDAAESKDANYRLYEILYRVAQKKNTIPAYTTFLATFQAAPDDLRQTALGNAVSLKCQSLEQEYRKYISQRQGDEVFGQFTIDKIGRRIYEEAISSKDNGDNVSFLQNYNTILECNLFSGSNTRFGLLRDAELANVLKNIESELKQIRKDLARSNELILNQLASIQTTQNAQNDYIGEIRLIVREQSHILNQMQKPLSWDDSQSAWDNFCRIGINAVDVLPVSDIFIKIIDSLQSERSV
jgi:hypothetical protein